MNNNLNIRDKQMIYLGSIPLIFDVFDEVFNVEDYLVAYNSKKLVIVNPESEIIVSEEGIVQQIRSWGKCIAFQKGNKVGVYHYDGTLLIPFVFHHIFIVDADDFVFKVQDTPKSNWRDYTLPNH